MGRIRSAILCYSIGTFDGLVTRLTIWIKDRFLRGYFFLELSQKCRTVMMLSETDTVLQTSLKTEEIQSEISDRLQDKLLELWRIKNQDYASHHNCRVVPFSVFTKWVTRTATVYIKTQEKDRKKSPTKSNATKNRNRESRWSPQNNRRNPRNQVNLYKSPTYNRPSHNQNSSWRAQNNPPYPPNINQYNYYNSASNQFNQGRTDKNLRSNFGGSYRNTATSQSKNTQNYTDPNNQNMSSDGRFEEINQISTEAEVHETGTTYVHQI